MRSAKVVVLADDLTSAAECAGQLAATGCRPVVRFDVTAADTGSADCVDLDSRALPEAEAVARTVQAHRAWVGSAEAVLYKTMDSSLRGNWAAELAAVLRERGGTTAVVAPAFPAYDRLTRDGVQFCEGVPAHLGPAGTDPRTPITQSSVVTALRATGLPTHHLRPDDDLPARLREIAASGIGAVVVDAETDADLDRIAAAVPNPADVVWCGSPGLSGALFARHTGEHAPSEVPDAVRPVLIAVGSLHPVTRRQLERLDGDTVWADSGSPDRLLGLLATRPYAAVATPSQADDAQLSHLTRLVVAASKVQPRLGLVLTGGDTARSVSEALGATGIEVTGTVAPGVPQGVLVGPHPHPVISKAGGFGDPDMLVHAAQALARRNQL
jgi:uncharacterized protein YgbK (DUF1537 family)